MVNKDLVKIAYLRSYLSNNPVADFSSTNIETSAKRPKSINLFFITYFNDVLFKYLMIVKTK